MNRPSLFTYLIGNPLSLLALWLVTAYLAYQWYGAQVPVIFPIMTGIAAIAASNAYQRLDKYRLWKREWETMNGGPSSHSRASIMRKPGVRIVLGLAIWCAMAYGALTLGNQPGTQVAAGLFWVATLVLIVGSLYRLARRKRATPKQAEIRDVPVTVCLKTPQQSPSLNQAFASLPEYCVPLFEKCERTNVPTTH